MENSNVIKLEGSRNWNLWKFQIMVVLRGHGLLDIVEGRSLKPKNEEEKAAWETKDAKAQMVLVTRIMEATYCHLHKYI